ncbi:metallophosphoesterase family protein [Actinospica durhamensis]|uniref:Metallophosphoesterase family protein n=1 Tax=Actinospica durhamensis TaxID=1508375 RepID=A0A941EY75_9ACTN|nr:metallophosphoesterase family protein [Actinospica durhamensis]MBR7838638.1 metallophosphoesterase family protein [Actinospica durhamensis]
MANSNLTPRDLAGMSIAEQHEWFKKATSRRSLLRGGLVGAGAIAAVGTVATGPASAAAGSSAATAAKAPGSASLLASADRPAGSFLAPFARHVQFGPDPTTSFAVTWQVPAVVSRPFVRIGHSPLELGEKISAELSVLSTPWGDVSPIDSVPLATPTTVEQYYVQARISHLLPGTTYYYAVGHDGYDPATRPGLEPVRTFTTAPKQAVEFTFTAFGDQGESYDAVATGNLVRSVNPAFHLHAGDLSYANDGGSGLLTNAYDPRVWDSFLVQNEPFASTVPWQAVVGNHEMEPWYSPDGYGGYFERFAQPVANQSYYSFTYGNVAFLALDANDVTYEYTANNGYSGGAQTTWLARQLAGFRANKNIDFIVAYFHECAYCTATAHASDGGVRAAWTPLFDQYSVDLVINGHNHVYERTDPLKAGAVTTSAPIGATVTPATQGTTYVVAGSAGNSLYAFTAGDSYEGAVENDSAVASWYRDSTGGKTNETVDWSRIRYTGYALLTVQARPGTRSAKPELVLSAINEAGTEIDRLTIQR